MTQTQRKIRYVLATIGTTVVLLAVDGLIWSEFLSDYMGAMMVIIFMQLIYLNAMIITTSMLSRAFTARLFRLHPNTFSLSPSVATMPTFIVWALFIMLTFEWIMEMLILRIVLLSVAILLLCLWHLEQWPKDDVASYLQHRDGRKLLMMRNLLLHAIQQPLWMGIAVLMAILFYINTSNDSVAYRIFTTPIIVYSCLIAPVYTRFLVTKVFKRWFVVADAESFSQWLVDKQTKQGEIHDTKTT
jgi:hypothetical protein